MLPSLRFRADCVSNSRPIPMLRRLASFANASAQPWLSEPQQCSKARTRRWEAGSCITHRPPHGVVGSGRRATWPANVQGPSTGGCTRAMCSSSSGQARGSPHPLAYSKAAVAAMTPRERELLRLRSKAIPLVADTEPLDIIFEDEAFLVVSKPQYVKMHPAHRFEGGTLVNRVIGYLNYNPHVAHR
jgi:hypothetical protein